MRLLVHQLAQCKAAGGQTKEGRGVKNHLVASMTQHEQEQRGPGVISPPGR